MSHSQFVIKHLNIYSAYSLLSGAVSFFHLQDIAVVGPHKSPSPMATSLQFQLRNNCDVALTGNLTCSNFPVNYERGLLEKILYTF